MAGREMTVLAAVVLVRLSEFDANQVHLAVANAFFGNYLLGELANGLGWSL